MCHACLIVSSAVIQRCSAPDMNTKYRVSYGIETMVWLKQHARTKPSRGSIDCSTRSIAPRHKTSTRLHLFKRILTILYSMTLTNLKVFAWCAICACPLVLCKQALVPARIKELVSGIFRNRLSILRNVQGPPIMMMTLSLPIPIFVEGGTGTRLESGKEQGTLLTAGRRVAAFIKEYVVTLSERVFIDYRSQRSPLIVPKRKASLSSSAIDKRACSAVRWLCASASRQINCEIDD